MENFKYSYLLSVMALTRMHGWTCIYLMSYAAKKKKQKTKSLKINKMFILDLTGGVSVFRQRESPLPESEQMTRVRGKKILAVLKYQPLGTFSHDYYFFTSYNISFLI